MMQPAFIVEEADCRDEGRAGDDTDIARVPACSNANKTASMIAPHTARPA